MSYDRGGKPVQASGDPEAAVAPAGAPTAPNAPSARGAAAIPPRSSARKVPLAARFRVLPVMIFLAALLLSVKVTAIWESLQASGTVISVATYAEAKQAPAGGAEKPGAPVAAAPKTEASGGAKPVQMAQTTTGKPASGDEKPLDPVLFTRSEIELLQELSKRRKELDGREQTIVQREGLLNAAENRIEKKIAELKGVKDDIELLIQKYEKQEEEQLNDLVAIYEKMKPKDASRIFNQLDIAILLQIFDKMKASKTALILANMKAVRAKEITSRIAERREMPKLN